MKWLAMVLLISSQASAWQVVNDSVMGGRSTSSIVAVDDYLRFAGFLSLENNGGFASVRSAVTVNANTTPEGIRLQVRGDGRQYQLRVSTRQAVGRASYAADFNTQAGEWIQVDIPVEDFYLTYRGFTYSNYPEVDLSLARSMSLYITDKLTGPFQLDLKSISAY